MTIRKHLNLTEYSIWYGTIAVSLAIFFAWYSRQPDMSKDQAIRWLLWMCLPGSAAAIILLNLFYRCPRCHASRGKLKKKQVRWNPDRYRLLSVGETLEACPQCHVSFDEPWK